MAVIATAAIAVGAAAFAMANPNQTPFSIAIATSAPSAAASIEFAQTTRPAPTCRVLPTPKRIEPSHAPVNGQPSLQEPTLSGVILIEIAQCRDIQAILVKYGLSGPATRNIDVPESDEMIANGATRWYRVQVTPGTESAIVVELYKHPEDIEYVQLIPEFTGGAAAG